MEEKGAIQYKARGGASVNAASDMIPMVINGNVVEDSRKGMFLKERGHSSPG
jgi:uncharacterized protein (DUF427 family)